MPCSSYCINISCHLCSKRYSRQVQNKVSNLAGNWRMPKLGHRQKWGGQ